MARTSASARTSAGPRWPRWSALCAATWRRSSCAASRSRCTPRSCGGTAAPPSISRRAADAGADVPTWSTPATGWALLRARERIRPAIGVIAGRIRGPGPSSAEEVAPGGLLVVPADVAFEQVEALGHADRPVRERRQPAVVHLEPREGLIHRRLGGEQARRAVDGGADIQLVQLGEREAR